MRIQGLPDNIVNYLMEGDHAIRWQTMKYLTGEDDEDIHLERIMLEFEGWGKELLDRQGSNGLWYESLMVNRYQSTIWILAILRRLGIYPLDQFIAPCQQILEVSQDFTGGIRLEGTDEIHPCISGLSLAICTYFRYLTPKVEAIFHYLIETQSADGSWVCTYHDDPQQHRFLTTLLVLEGLLEYQKIYPRYDNFIRNMQYQAHEFLFSHYLFKLDPTSTTWMDSALSFQFPIYNYDILTVLDYFRKAQVYDRRMNEALTKLKQMGNNYRYSISPTSGELPFSVQDKSGFNRFNTMRALRVLTNLRPQ